MNVPAHSIPLAIFSFHILGNDPVSKVINARVKADTLGIDVMDFDILVIISFEVLKVPDIIPYITPGMRKTIKINGTIDRIKGAANEVISPSGARNAESAG